MGATFSFFLVKFLGGCQTELKVPEFLNFWCKKF